jgi:hypothetical protein
MEMDVPSKGSETAVLEALEAVEPSQATRALSGLAEALHARGADELDLNHAWKAFKRLLSRRGYFVDTPAKLIASLKEIQQIGEGFDLFDLARSLARYDAVRTKCRHLAGSRTLPSLSAFAPDCACTKHRKET